MVGRCGLHIDLQLDHLDGGCGSLVTLIAILAAGTIECLLLVIDRQQDKRCARVQGTVTLPVEVLYTDAHGVDGSATGTVSIPVDVLLYIPAPSIIPFSVSAVASVVAPEGTFVSVTEGFTVSLCVTVILRVSMPVEILVPSYGYCVIPPAQEYSQEVCEGFFELPLYPQAKPNACKCER